MPAMVEQVLLAEPRGFCAGVEMAIKALTWMTRIFAAPVYCYHQIVHNAAVVGAFEAAGVVFVEDLDAVPPGAPLMLSAHGSSPEVIRRAQERGAVVVDAVCPLVTKVHHEVRRLAAAGYEVLYVGHRGHDEAVGTIAEAPAATTLVDPEAGLGGFSPADPGRVALLAQTTLGHHGWEGVLAAAAASFPQLWTARRSDLCYATTNRQSAVEVLARKADLVLVVGSANSSNTRALVRVARAAGVAAHRVEGPASIDPGWLTGVRRVGVTAGASAPDGSVRAVVDFLAPSAGVEVLGVTAEEEYFPPPPQLRALLGALQSAVEGGFGAGPSASAGPLDDDHAWGAARALELLAAGKGRPSASA
jgi:4-hydroxy-3-methylbut-2-enyl diphosphate reductase